MGGEVFDVVAAAPGRVQATFLHILRELRRSPHRSASLEILNVEGAAGAAAYIGALNGVLVRYTVVDDPRPHLLIIDAMWV